MWGTAGAKRLEERFSTMADSCTRFSREIIEMLGPEAQTMRPIEHERQNLEILRSMFAKWTLEVLTVLYQGRRVGFKRIGNEVGISGKSLSRKLLHMESLELVEREIVQSRPVRVEYSLTEKGLRIVKLGEPVMLYLRYKQGLLVRDTVDLDGDSGPVPPSLKQLPAIVSVRHRVGAESNTRTARSGAAGKKSASARR